MQFDSKLFNGEAFGKYVETLPKVNKNELLKSGALVPSAEIKNLLSTHTGSFYGTLPMFGRIGGDAQNYDGVNDINSNSMETFSRSVIACGRANAWTEKDFAVDVTSGVDFMSEVGKQVSDYWDDVNTDILFSVLKGVFSMTGTANKAFVNNHTHNISVDAVNNTVGATTLNVAIQRACGDQKAKFSMVLMHSNVATNLENLNLLNHLKYTDPNGIQRDLALGTWNGRTVLIDDCMPAVEGYYDATSDTEGALKIVASGASTGEINLAEVTNYFGSKTLKANDYVVAGVQYTSYVLGNGAIEYADLGVNVPFEMSRDPKTNGGVDTLYSRERLCYAPYGLTFTKSNVTTLSPTNAELEDGSNWSLVNNGKSGGNLKTIEHKVIPIARILSRG
jgi:hypothetical protein